MLHCTYTTRNTLNTKGTTMTTHVLTGVNRDNQAVIIETNDDKEKLSKLAKKLSARGIYSGMMITQLTLEHA